MDKRTIGESQKLHNAYRAALAEDFSREIGKLENEILALNDEHQKEFKLRHEQAAQKLRVEIDNRRHRIVSLVTQRGDRATVALLELKRFNRPHKKILFQRLQRPYEVLERQKFHEIVSADDTQFFGKMMKIKTNVVGVMESQLKISKIYEEYFGNEAVPLGEILQKVESVEQARHGEFPTLTITIHERERPDFIDNLFISHEQMNDVNYTITILPSSILQSRIESVQIFTKPRQMAA